MAVVINGSGTVTGLAVGGLPDGTVDAGTLADDAVGLAQMASGTDGNLITYDASGNPAAVAVGTSGQVLTSNGAGAAPTMATLPAGGLSEVDNWRLSTSFTPGSEAQYILSNWARTSETGYGRLGTGMTESSGIFTFPSTGIWEVTYHINVYNSNVSGYMHMCVKTTVDNGSNWTCGATDFGAVDVAGRYTGLRTICHFDVTNTSTHKCKFEYYIYDPSTATVLSNRTDVIFKKLGAT